MLNFPSGWHQAATALGHFEVLENVVLATGEVGLHDFEQCSREQSMGAGVDQVEIFSQRAFVKSAIARSLGLRWAMGSTSLQTISTHEATFFDHFSVGHHVGYG